MSLSGNDVRNNTAYEGGGIYLYSVDNCTMTGTTVTDNYVTGGQAGGIYVSGDGQGVRWASFAGNPNCPSSWNQIYGNEGYCLYNGNDFDPSGDYDIDARYVWWGTCDIDPSQDCIYDYFDDPTRALVIKLPIAYPFGDFDEDCDVDLDDFSDFAQCYNSSMRPPAPACPAGVVADYDCDGDVDLDDFAIFAANYTGAQ